MIPQLSVIIPTYKRSDSLEKLIDCLNEQKNVLLEIIIVDQNKAGFFTGSLALKLSKLIHLKQSCPNASLARNTGFKKANAPYILFLDDDLVPDTSFCFNGISVFLKFPLIKSFIPLVFSEEGKKLAYNNSKRKFLKYYPENHEIFSITDSMSAAVFFERTYFFLTGGFDVHLFDFAKTSEDHEFFLRMKRKKMLLWFVPFVEIFHDDKIAGGCELRTSGYWETRKKCIRAMAYRHRIHKSPPGNLSISDLIQLVHSSVLNKKVISSGILNIVKEINLLLDSIKQSRYFFIEHKKQYSTTSVGFIGE